PDGESGHEPRLLRPHPRVRLPHRLRGARQHVLQRPRRADRLLTRGRLSLLYADSPRLPGARPVPPRQGGTARVEGERELETGVPARLTPAEGRKFGLLVGAAFLL